MSADTRSARLRGLIAALLGRRAVAVCKSPASQDLVPPGNTAHARPTTVTVSGSQPGWLRVLGADALLQVVQAHKAITEIGRISRLSRPVFERDCLSALRRYAEFVQLLPASEAHHHAHAGGLLSHTIEMLLAALTWRNGRLLPEGAPIEVIDAQRDEWTLVVFYAALLHDVGKALTDVRITWRARNLDPVRWMPLAGSLVEVAQGRARAEYLVQFAPKVERDYSAHGKTAVLLLRQLASPTALAILARQPEAFEALNRYLCGQDRDSLLASIVREADRASVRRALASGSRARFATAQAVPLVQLLMQALKTLLRDGTELPLNRNGAAGWVYDGSLWLVARRTTKVVREWINRHEPGEALPSEDKNDRLFDIWLEYGCIVPNPVSGKSIWHVTVHGKGGVGTAGAADAGAKDDAGQSDAGTNKEPAKREQGAYSNPLAMLRFALDKLYDDPSRYPPPMLGMIEVHAKRQPRADDADADADADADDDGQDVEPMGDDDGGAPDASASVQPGHQAAPMTGNGAPQTPSRPDKPAPPQEPAIKAPTFNKPKPARPEPVPPAAGPLQRHTGATVAAAPPARTPLIMPADEAEYLLDPEDAADPRAMQIEREQRLLVKTARQAHKPASDSTSSPSAPVQSGDKPQSRPAVSTAAVPAFARQTFAAHPQKNDQRLALSQPVGGTHRLLLQAAPVLAARSDVDADANGDINETPAQGLAGIRPILLEPRLPKLPASKHHAGEREAIASPVALAFLAWVLHGLEHHTLTYNQTGAMVHFVEQGMALVSPLIFKKYAATQVSEHEIETHAMFVQKEVVKARWHVPGPNNTNILKYKVVGRGGEEKGQLVAVVLARPQLHVHPVPPSNPALKLV